MLNNNTMTLVKSLLDEPEVYRYKDISEENTAEKQMEADLTALSDEVLFNELLDVLTEDIYAQIQGKAFAAYNYNDKKLYYAEAYFIAALFLEKFALKNESENFKSQVDFANRTSVTEKSGKIFSAYEYRKRAKNYLARIDSYSSVNPEGMSLSISRY